MTVLQRDGTEAREPAGGAESGQSPLGLIGAFLGVLSAYSSLDLRVLAQGGQFEPMLVALTAAATTVAKVFAAFFAGPGPSTAR